MNRNFIRALLLVVAMALVPLAAGFASGSVNLAQVRRATASFHNIGTAKAAGYQSIAGLDDCFDNQPVGGMGYHLINPSFLNDTQLDPLHPEALVYARGGNGGATGDLVAVEYIVPAIDWNEPSPPSLFGQTFDFHADLGVYALHAWIWRQNPNGMFKDWNPKVSCP